MMLSLLSPGGTERQTEVMPYPCATHGQPCASARSSARSGQVALQREAGEQAGNRKPGRSMPPFPCKRKGGSALLPPFNSLALASGSGLREQLVDIFPVDEIIDERLQVIRTAVAIIDVVGMLPDVDAEDRGRAMHQRVFAVRRLGDFELAVLHRQPRPARAELADTGGGEIGLEFF